ncbi:MAG TPA: GIY-YIG nuclease family protein, partial [Patescibacteria group bacterium]|nr:GIY-YIG nuclease family protein [Patescibacteria group bacterium]
MKHLREVAKLLPEAPGVYIFRGSDHAVIYVGKAVNLRRRVGSYLVGAHDDK